MIQVSGLETAQFGVGLVGHHGAEKYLHNAALQVKVGLWEPHGVKEGPR